MTARGFRNWNRGFPGVRHDLVLAKNLLLALISILCAILGLTRPEHDLETTKTLEQQHGYLPFSTDLYGIGPELSMKRQTRRWKPETSISILSDGLEDVVKRLLQWKGGQTGTEIFPQELPWEREILEEEWEKEVVQYLNYDGLE
jgi:hypothetical protein